MAIYKVTLKEYTLHQAQKDGIVINIAKKCKQLKNSPISHISSKLLENGYIKNNKINYHLLLELLIQCIGIAYTQKDKKEYTTKIKLANKKVKTIKMAPNSIKCYTLMLLDEY